MSVLRDGVVLGCLVYSICLINVFKKKTKKQKFDHKNRKYKTKSCSGTVSAAGGTDMREKCFHADADVV